MRFTPQELREQTRGAQAFTCTPFSGTLELDLKRFRSHLGYLAGGEWPKPAGFFVCCGTGELWSLHPSEHLRLVEAAVDEVGRSVPVVAGIGYGTAMAVELAQESERRGAEGVLVFPPYLVRSTQEGLYRHYGKIAQSVRCAVMVYNRDNAIFGPETLRRLAAMPNVVGLKDGHGDMQLLSSFQSVTEGTVSFVNGMPSAETHQERYLAAGVRSYSPGVLDFMPELSWVFDEALEQGRSDRLRLLMDGFYAPYTELRGRAPGYGVAMVKSGLRLRGMPAGGVRPPLVDPKPDEEQELGELVARGLELARRCAAGASAPREGGRS